MNGLDELVEGFLGPLHDGQMKHHCVYQAGGGGEMALDQVVTEAWTWMSPGIGVPHLSYLETILASQEAALVCSQRFFHGTTCCTMD